MVENTIIENIIIGICSITLTIVVWRRLSKCEPRGYSELMDYQTQWHEDEHDHDNDEGEKNKKY